MNEFLNNSKMAKNGLIGVLVFLALFLAVKTIHEVGATYGENYPANQTITVSGKGEVISVPDIATISFSVVEEAKTVADAQKKATDRSNKAMDYLKKAGIADKDIKTTFYSIYPKYEQQYQSGIPCYQGYCPQPTKSVVIGYEVSQGTEVKIRDISKAGDILTGVGTIGVQNVSGLSFSVDKIDDVRREARDKAIADARAEASKLAKALGVRLVKVVSYNDSSYYPVYAKMMSSDVAYGRGGGEVAAAPSISVGEDKITANVSVTFEIR